MNLDALIDFKNKFNFNPSTILDIGASNGWFSNLCLQVWPDSDITMIEANPILEESLKNTNIPYSICLLGNENKIDVPFYISKIDPASTGNSIYKETSEYFNDYDIKLLPMYKLDDITKFPFDFIKMDTQGSELDIIKGGKNTIDKAKYLLVEVSLIECNEGAPLKDDIVNYLKSVNFNLVDVVYSHYLDNKIVQEDVLFKHI